MKRPFLSLGLFLVGTAEAAMDYSPCFLNLAVFFAADGPAPVELIENTYDRLLDNLLPNPEKDQISGDPFSAEERGKDLLSLNRALANLKGMLEQRGWNTPEVRGRLKEAVKRRTERTVAQKEKQTHVVAKSWRDFSWTGSHRHPTHVFSADGKWLVYFDIPYVHIFQAPNSIPVVVQNLETGEKLSYTAPGNYGYEGKLVLTPGDDKLVFFTMDDKTGEDRALFVPFQKGVPKFADLRPVAIQNVSKGMSAGGDPHYWISPDRTAVDILNPRTERVERVSLDPRVHKQFQSAHLTALGGTGLPNQFYLQYYDNQTGGGLVVITTDGKGKIVSESVAGRWNGSQTPIRFQWTPEGTPRSYADNAIVDWPVPDQPQTVMAIPKTVVLDGFEYRRGVGTVRGDHAAVAYHSLDDGVFLYLDLAAKKQYGPFPLPPEVEAIDFSPDGERLLVKAKKTVHVLNYHMRLGGP